MRIDDNSYYIKYYIDPDGKEFAFLTHYIDVYDNGYDVDDYSFDPHYFEYEDAGHHGINPDDSYAGTRILKRYYDRWVKRTVECKSEIERMAYTASTPYGKEWAVGDYLLFPMKEVFAQIDAKEAEKYPDDYVEEEIKYTGPELTLIQVTKNDSQNPEGFIILVGKYGADYDEEPRSIKYYLDYIDQSRLIPKEVYDKSTALICKTSTEIMAEIKRKVKEIEYIRV